jgi:hypothetical protein
MCPDRADEERQLQRQRRNENLPLPSYDDYERHRMEQDSKYQNAKLVGDVRTQIYKAEQEQKQKDKEQTEK